MRVLIFYFSFILLIPGTFGQSSFYKVFSGLGYDVGEGVAELEDSSFVVTGSSTSWEGSSQVFLMKVDSAGQRLWTQHYGGPEAEGASRVLFNKDLGIYAIGYTNSIGMGDYNGLVVKTDNDGNELWQKAIGETNAWEFLHDAVFGRDSSIFMVGESQDLSDGDKDVYMVRLNRDGDTLWTNKILSPGIDYASSIVNIQDSMFIVGGSFYCEDSLSQKGFIMKVSEAGEIQWKKTLGNKPGPYAIEDVTVSLDKISAIGSRIVSEDNHDSYLVRFDFDGNLLSEQTENDPNAEGDVIMDEITYVYSYNRNVIGYRVINEFSFQENYDSNIAYFNETSLLWLNNFVSISYLGLDQVNQLMATSDGGFVGVGQTTYPISGGSNIFVFKSAPSGEMPNTGEYYTIDTLVGVDVNPTITSFSISPNPCINSISFDFEGTEKNHVELYNSLGILVYSATITSGKPYDVSFLHTGCYYGRFNRENFKLIKL